MNRHATLRRLAGLALLLVLAGCVTQPTAKDPPAQGSSTGQQSEPVAVGAAVGALLGVVAGDRKNAAIAGAVVGGVPGSQRPELAGWRNLSGPDTTVPGAVPPALLTYVLVGDIGGAGYAGANHSYSRAHDNLAALLRELRALPTEASPSATVRRRALNLFLIPATSPRPAVSELQRPYDFNAAAEYLVTAQALVDGQAAVRGALAGTGPFLVSSRLPLSQNLRERLQATRQRTPILVMDLSGVEPRAMPAYVAAFNQALRSTDLARDQALELLRPAIVSALLKLDAAIPFIGAAYGGVAGMATGSATGK
ncbi:MAG: hypothetical protein V4795_19695 [Pseudomonadota bacterium]